MRSRRSCSGPAGVRFELDGQLDGVGQELVQRWIEQPDRDGQPGHRAQDALEVRLLHRQQALERALAAFLVAGEDHLANHGQAILGHEHVLRATEPDALCAERARALGILGRVRVRAHPEASALVGPRADREEVLRDHGGDERHRPRISSPVPPSIVMTSPSRTTTSPTVKVRFCTSMRAASTPATQGLPMPRATTAACEVMPPCAVTTPCA